MTHCGESIDLYHGIACVRMGLILFMWLLHYLKNRRICILPRFSTEKWIAFYDIWLHVYYSNSLEYPLEGLFNLLTNNWKFNSNIMITHSVLDARRRKKQMARINSKDQESTSKIKTCGVLFFWYIIQWSFRLKYIQFQEQQSGWLTNDWIICARDSQTALLPLSSSLIILGTLISFEGPV